MKELQKIHQDKLEVVAEKPIIKELKFIGQLRPHKGQQCFQLEVATGIVTPAEFQNTTVLLNAQDIVNKRIVAKDGCIYVCALNKQNTQKKFIKMLLPHLKNNL